MQTLWAGDSGLKQIVRTSLLSIALIFAGAIACSSQEPAIEDVTAENFQRLLTLDDVENASILEANLNENFTDYKQLAESLDPRNVVETEAWLGVTFTASDNSGSLTFTVIDFTSQDAAADHFNQISSDARGASQFEVMSQPIGDASIENAAGDDGRPFIAFRKGDKVVQLHASLPVTANGVASASELESLAQLVESRLK